jgi:plastocyanin
MSKGSTFGLIGAAGLVFGGASAAGADTFEVTMALFSFMYDGEENLDIDLTIQPGDTVRWVWISGMHNVSSGTDGEKDDGVLFFSGPPQFGPNEFEYTFEEPGEYFYHCDAHVDFGMESFVTVEGAGCKADVNGDGVLNILDFVAFQGLFQQADPAADCNEDEVFNILDFVCYQGLFQAGCP